MLKFQVTEQIEMRLLVKDDASKLFELVDSNRSYLRQWLPWLDANTEIQHSVDFIETIDKQYKANLGFNCGVFFENELVGVCGYHEINHSNNSVVIGYWLAENIQGKGIMTSCAQYLINYAFETLKLNKVSISAAIENDKSRAVIERLGLTYEGMSRQAEYLYDRYIDLACYSILHAEWQQLK